MTDMKHGKPEDEFGINSTAELLGKIEDKDQDSFVLQEKPVITETPVRNEEPVRAAVGEPFEPVREETAVYSVKTQSDTKEVVQPILSKEPERKKVKERPLKKETTRNQEKKRLSRSALVLIIGIIIIAIPVLIFAGILGISALQTGTPRIGSRFDGDLQPAITDSDVAALKTELSAIGSVEDVEVLLAQGQLKIFIDTIDSLSAEQVDSILMSAYNKVIAKLPIGTYFTGDDSRKMYDLQINVYTSSSASAIGDENGRQYKLLHKNSTEETYGIDDMAHPKDPALAAELEGLTPEPVVEDTEEGDGE
ncbi:MAG: hypothetical protein IIW22_06375 [Erysipelotrichaceae bacterium]|nr:hypothetical protein [Erysipelotrichaceae bacterium]